MTEAVGVDGGGVGAASLNQPLLGAPLAAAGVPPSKLVFVDPRGAPGGNATAGAAAAAAPAQVPRPSRGARKRADVHASLRDSSIDRIVPEGTVWACCCASKFDFDAIRKGFERGAFDPTELAVTRVFSDVIFLRVLGAKAAFIFTFGCVVGWDLSSEERLRILYLLRQYRAEPDLVRYEEDEMSYVRVRPEDGELRAGPAAAGGGGGGAALGLGPAAHRGSAASADLSLGLPLADPSPAVAAAGGGTGGAPTTPMIRLDTIRLSSERSFEQLAYSYAFAQCVKLSYFEDNVDDTIERTKSIPESLAKTGKINCSREEISKRIGELFTSRFYINLHTDILDTPEIFWEFDEFCDQYVACRNYLEIPKRVDILNQRLDIIKDLYDMLNDELTIEHGHRLEWIVIYLICVEVAIEVIWNILIKDILKLV